jgi:hypothetical protein
LVEAFGTLDPHQNHPLGARDSELRRSMIGVGTQKASYVIENKSKFAVKRERWHSGALSW